MGIKALKLIVCALSLVASIEASFNREIRIGPRLQPGVRIVNGEVVDEKWDGRWICSFWDAYYGFTHICGASLIDETTAVTAAHCASAGWHEDYALFCGERQMNDISVNSTSPTLQWTGIANVIPHDGFDSETLKNDICLLKLVKPMHFDEHVKNVLLPENPEVPDNTTCYAYGWGVTQEGGSYLAPQLMKVDLQITPINDCINSYANLGWDVIPECMICATDSGKDSCQGDSGGPLICNENILTGIVSWGYGCARNGYPGVYTKVSRFNSWIMDCAGANCTQPTCGSSVLYK